MAGGRAGSTSRAAGPPDGQSGGSCGHQTRPPGAGCAPGQRRPGTPSGSGRRRGALAAGSAGWCSRRGPCTSSQPTGIPGREADAQRPHTRALRRTASARVQTGGQAGCGRCPVTGDQVVQDSGVQGGLPGGAGGCGGVACLDQQGGHLETSMPAGHPLADARALFADLPVNTDPPSTGGQHGAGQELAVPCGRVLEGLSFTRRGTWSHRSAASPAAQLGTRSVCGSAGAAGHKRSRSWVWARRLSARLRQ
jgi:hypothetical protein